MARWETPLKTYDRKRSLGTSNAPEYRVTPAPLLWHRENNNLIYQAFMVLQSGLTAVPLIAGMDKFVEILANWPQYLAPGIPQILGMSSQSFMYLVGFVEIIIAIGVALYPRIFSYVVMGWFIAIIINLLMLGQYFDIVLRDFGLAVAAFALSRLSQLKEEVPFVAAETNDISTPELAH
ncbi:MAG: hypothetical protein ACXWC9_10655 [Pseudobdellovibrionaceae bacterium]